MLGNTGFSDRQHNSPSWLCHFISGQVVYPPLVFLLLLNRENKTLKQHLRNDGEHMSKFHFRLLVRGKFSVDVFCRRLAAKTTFR